MVKEINSINCNCKHQCSVFWPRTGSNYKSKTKKSKDPNWIVPQVPDQAQIPVSHLKVPVGNPDHLQGLLLEQYELVSQGYLRATKQPFPMRCSQCGQGKISCSCECDLPEFWWHICEESQDKLCSDARMICSWDEDVAALLKDPLQEHGARVDVRRCGRSLLHGQLV